LSPANGLPIAHTATPKLSGNVNSRTVRNVVSLVEVSPLLTTAANAAGAIKIRKPIMLPAVPKAPRPRLRSSVRLRLFGAELPVTTLLPHDFPASLGWRMRLALRWRF
jgi:hypothetical protein